MIMHSSPIPLVIIGDETISSVEEEELDEDEWEDEEDVDIFNDEDMDDDEYDLDGYNAQSGGSVGNKYMPFRIHIADKGFTYVECGSFRATYIRKGAVIKVPRNADGEVDNRVEAAAWHKYKNKPTSEGLYLAPCRLLSNGCLLMMTVDLSQDYEQDVGGEIDTPNWVYEVEGYQVGMYHGKLVAYDYALDMPERIKWEEEWGVESETYTLVYRQNHESYYEENEE